MERSVNEISENLRRGILRRVTEGLEDEEGRRVARTGRSTSTMILDPAVTDAPAAGEPMATLWACASEAHRKAIEREWTSFMVFSVFEFDSIH